MGTRPEDMRYEIGRLEEGGEPWLMVRRGAAEWPGHGLLPGRLEPVASVRELRVAWQKQQRHDDLVGFCSRLIAPNPGVAVRAVSGSDPSEVVFEGRAVGFQDLPSVIVELENGTRRQWVAPLLRVESPTAVWDSVVPPGGMVCTTCGIPVETEPCPDHGTTATDEPSAGPCPMETPDVLPGRSS